MRQAGRRGGRRWRRSEVLVLGARAAKRWCAKYCPAKVSCRAQATASARAQVISSARAQATASTRAQAAASAQPEEQCAAESAGTREDSRSACHPGLEFAPPTGALFMRSCVALGQALHPQVLHADGPPSPSRGERFLCILRAR